PPSCPGCSAGPPPNWRPSWARGTNERSSTATTWYCSERSRRMSVQEQGGRARAAAAVLATTTRAVKDAALRAMADALVSRTQEVLTANEADVAAGREAGLSNALVDRLSLSAQRVESMAG